ncbi:hypothetical protein LTR85_001853 [Meristemomyces frigidus]|nr:hypothetical protein LTR85_001853 [Meristemomyces frigidus]
MDDSPLAKLPPELRNNIYELALRYKEPIVVSSADALHRRRAQIFSPNGLDSGIFGLAMTCNAIRKECLLLYYSVNEFSLHTDGIGQGDDGLRPLYLFRRIIGREAAMALRCVTLRTNSYRLVIKLLQSLMTLAKEDDVWYKLTFPVRYHDRAARSLLPSRELRPRTMNLEIDMQRIEETLIATILVLPDAANDARSNGYRRVATDIDDLRAKLETCRKTLASEEHRIVLF